MNLSDFTEAIICGNPESISSRKWMAPIPIQFVFDINKIENYIKEQPKSTSFILVILDFDSENIQNVLINLSQRDNILGILIDGTSTINLQNNHGKIFRIPRQSMANELVFHGINAYQFKSNDFHDQGQQGAAMICEEKASKLKDWLLRNFQINPCDILIYPVNTDFSNTVDFQLRLMKLCKRLYPKRKLTICTLYDYIPSEEYHLLESSDPNFKFRYELRRTICRLMKQIARIRFGLIGNEDFIDENWCSVILETEKDDSQFDAFEYVQKSIFIKNEPVNEAIEKNLLFSIKDRWNVTQTEVQDLDHIEKDPDFYCAIWYIDDTRDTYQKTINIRISAHQLAITHQETSSDYSERFRATGEAQDALSNENHDSEEEMDRRSQR